MLPMVADMQKWGFKIDRGYLSSLAGEFRCRMDTLIEEMREMPATKGADFNPGSDPQVFALLKKLGLEKRPTMYKGATDHVRLEGLEDRNPVIGKVIEWRGYKKLLSSFLDVLPQKADSQDRIHTTLRITRVITGRLSSSNPNLMAQPVRSEDGRRIRGGFVAEDGYSLLSGDYSQVEMRGVAHMSQDPVMVKVFRDNKDIHSETASGMFHLPVEKLDEMQHRYPAKRVGFGILNLISEHKLLKEMNAGGAKGWTLTSCKRLIYDWFAVYQGVAEWIEEQKTFARRHGYVVDMWGRVRYSPELLSVHEDVIAAGVRQSVNAPIQMSAQGIIKEAMGQLVPLYKAYKGLMRPLIQIHDDLVWEIHDSILQEVTPMVRLVMEGAAPFMDVPLRVDFKVGKRWNQMEKIKV
jgi:DNA polymerase-1